VGGEIGLKELEGFSADSIADGDDVFDSDWIFRQKLMD